MNVVMMRVVLILMLLPGTGLAADTPQVEANRLYEAGRFADAAEQYQRALEGGLRNGDLYYNLGNAQLHSGRLGAAILNYLRARYFLPRDQDVQANLNYALRRTEDRMDGGFYGPLETYLFWVPRFNLQEWLVWVTGANLAFWIGLGWYLVRPRNGLHKANVLLAVLLAFTLVSAGLRFYWERAWNYGVVVNGSVELRSDARPESEELLILHEGAILKMGRESNGWVRASLPDGVSGWLQKSSIQSARPL